MSYGLSDRDRERLEKGRREAAEKMEQERRRLREDAELEAEHKAKQQAETQRLGPRTVTGPDGVPVELRVAPSGMPGFWGLSSAMSADSDGCLILLPVVVVVGVLGWLNHLVIYRLGHTVHITPEGRPKGKLRERSEEAAARRMAELAEAIERDGLVALR